MGRILLIFFLLNAGLAFGQNKNVSNELVKASFDKSYRTRSEKRKLLTFKKKYARFNPINYLGAGLLFVYQNVMSEQIQADCTYKISCSEFTKLSIQEYGFIKGTLNGFNQLSECHPQSLYEHPMEDNPT